MNLSVGDVNTTAAVVLDGAQQDLMTYHLDKLADDAQWPAVQSDILTLGKDCPKALAEAMSIDRGGS